MPIDVIVSLACLPLFIIFGIVIVKLSRVNYIYICLNDVRFLVYLSARPLTADDIMKYYRLTDREIVKYRDKFERAVNKAEQDFQCFYGGDTNDNE